MPSPKKISQFKPLITNLAQTSHYQVIFGGLSSDLFSYLESRGIDKNFITEDAGLLCSSASLPGSGLATADINGNFMGVMERFAHTRIFTQIDLEFYVDSNYKMLKFLEHWMEFVSSGSEVDQNQDGYYYRMRYPYADQDNKNGGYKSNSTRIIKFDRNYKTEVEYKFIGMFPINLSSVAVSYDTSQALKVNASFNFERYIAGKTNSIDIKLGQDNNKSSTNPKSGSDSKFSDPADYLPKTTFNVTEQTRGEFAFNTDSLKKLGQEVGRLE